PGRTRRGRRSFRYATSGLHRWKRLLWEAPGALRLPGLHAQPARPDKAEGRIRGSLRGRAYLRVPTSRLHRLKRLLWEDPGALRLPGLHAPPARPDTAEARTRATLPGHRSPS